MRKFSKYGWMNVAFSAALTLSLLACGGNKNTGGAGNTDINSAIPKVSTTDNGGNGGLDTKDSATDDANDICSSQKDAYAVYGNYTLHQRDYVFNIAKEDGFDSLYTAKPATQTAVDEATALTYYVQSDKQLMGKLSAKIEMQYAAFQTALDQGEYKYAYKAYSELSMMTQARKSLVAFYNTIFGLKASWVESKDLDGELAAAVKPAREKVAAIAEADLSAAKKAELDSFIVEAAKMNTMRIDNKDYAVHTVFDKDRDARVELVAIATASNYATYKDYKDVAYVTAVKERVEYYAAQTEELEAKYAVQYAAQHAANPAEFAATTVTFQQQYKDVTASKELVASFMTGYSRAIGTVAPAAAATAPSNANASRVEELKKQLDANQKELNAPNLTAEQKAKLLAERDRLIKELNDAQNAGTVDSQSDTNSWAVPARAFIDTKDKDKD